MPSLNSLVRITSKLLIALIVGLRPILGPAICKFEPTCTKFAVQKLAQLPLHQAMWAIIKRLFSCNPFV